jgi:hypothetical protein
LVICLAKAGEEAMQVDLLKLLVETFVSETETLPSIRLPLVDIQCCAPATLLRLQIASNYRLQGQLANEMTST